MLLFVFLSFLGESCSERPRMRARVLSEHDEPQNDKNTKEKRIIPKLGTTPWGLLRGDYPRGSTAGGTTCTCYYVLLSA